MRIRKLMALALCLVVGAATLTLASPPDPAAALTGSDFRPGMIITDELFYDSSAMTAAEVQAFLTSHIAGACKSGYTCLKDYRQTTTTRAKDSYCAAYTGHADEQASTIIDSVARACGVSQMVLLVLLQKEQALVTSQSPSAATYQKATGFGCPDGAACSSKYYGFYNQVYNAARQYQIYRAKPGNYGYQQGRDNYIQYSPDTSCGGSQVYIQNQATAGLYIYTPYQPNAAALKNLTGSGDSCSAFGNRNFWRQYNVWFGSTDAYPVHGGIGAEYRSLGSATGYLGISTSVEKCTLKDSGCYQNFRGGQIHWTSTTGAHATHGGIAGEWRALDWENGELGYPTSDENCTLKDSGCYQNYQGGQIHWTSTTGAHATHGGIAGEWKKLGWENGELGYPTADEKCGLKDSGCYQHYQGGQIHWTAKTGAHATVGGIAAQWKALGWENSRLGYPTSDESCNAAHTECVQQYQGGTISWVRGHGETVAYR